MSTTVQPDVHTGTRVLRNYVGGAWIADHRCGVARRAQPGQRRGAGAGAAVGPPPTSTRPWPPRARRCPAWRAVRVIERARWLFALREALNARADEDWPARVTTEMGKTIADARAEVGAHDRDGRGRVRDPDHDAGPHPRERRRSVDCETIRQPVGVCAAIVPFNFPAMVPFWFLPFAIACGNTFILKPSEQVPLTQEIVFEIIDGLDLPPGVVNLVNGGARGRQGHPRAPGHRRDLVRRLGPVARYVYEGAAQAGKRVQALGGAKNHMVVMPDAVIGKTVDGHHRLGLRRGRPALHGGLGGRHRRRGARAPHAAADRGDGALRVGDGMDEGVRSGRSSRAPRATASRGWIDRGVERRRHGRRRRARARRRPRRRVRRADDPRRRDARDGDRAARRSSGRC